MDPALLEYNFTFNVPLPKGETLLLTARDKNMHQHKTSSTFMFISSFIINKSCRRLNEKQHGLAERHCMWWKTQESTSSFGSSSLRNSKQLGVSWCLHFSIPTKAMGYGSSQLSTALTQVKGQL